MIREVFSQVKQNCNITGRALSQVTGLTEPSISNFIHGKKDLTVTSLCILLEGMEKLHPGAIQSFCFLLAGTNFEVKPSEIKPSEIKSSEIKSSEMELDADQIADQIIALGTAWKKLQKKSKVEIHA